jgi:hypothetical protein
MPAPQSSMLKQLTKTLFMAKGLIVPDGWKQPTGEKGEQYNKAFKPEELATVPLVPALFQAASTNKLHTDAQKKNHDGFTKYIDGICDAICDAVDQWMKLSMITGAIINGPVGVVIPGNVQGPPLMPFILGKGPMANLAEIKFTKAIASAFSTAWQAWHMGVAGTLTFPPFASVPMPSVPPTPCVPMPVIAMSSAGESMLSGSQLKNLMVANLGDPTAQYSNELFDSIGNAFNTVFMTWKGTTMINVQGTGPVAGFAPPLSPTGAVAGGTTLPIPGAFK